MSPPVTTPEELRRRYDAVKKHGSVTQAAIALGISRGTLQHSMRAIETNGLPPEEPDIEIPDLPSDKMPTDKLIKHMRERFVARKTARDAREWMKYKVKLDGPVALAFVGDPHLDDNGCNWPQLEKDLAILRKIKGMFPVGLGDYTNSWSGRLAARVYPYQEATKPQALQLAEWFFTTVSWIILLKGNHDLWMARDGNMDPLDWMKKGAAPLEDWRAQIELTFPKGEPVKIDIAHNFKGSSMWNNLHGPLRASMLDGRADLYVAGDHHNWGAIHCEHAERKSVHWVLRARGYKYIDPHAERYQFASQSYGATMTAVIDPEDTGPNRITCFADVGMAAEFLKWKRGRR